MTRRHYKDKIFIVITLMLAFFLRIDDVGNWPVRWDEAFSVWQAKMDFTVGTSFTAGDVHPPLYFWLLHIWLRLTGSSEFAIRMLSTLLGVITTAIMYILTLRLSKRRIAASLALLLITLSPFHIEWSQDVRMYPLATMFATLAIYAYSRRSILLLIIGGIGVLFSHYFGFFVIGILILHHFIHWRKYRHSHRQFFIAIAVIAAVFMIWVAYAYPLIRRDPGLAVFDPMHAFKLMASVFALDKSAYIDRFLPLTLLVTAIFFLGLILNWRGNRPATTLLILGCVLPPAIVSALALPFVPLHVNRLEARHYVIFSPFVFAGFGIGLSFLLRRQLLRTAGIIACIGLMVLNVYLISEKRNGHYFRDDYRSAMAAIAAFTTKDDKVFFISGGRKPVVYYHLDRVGYDVPTNYRAEPLNVTGVPRLSGDVPAMMEWLFAEFPHFWLIEIEAHLDNPPGFEGLTPTRISWINDNYHRIYHIPIGHNGISFYSKNENDTIPDLDIITPPVITEARPGDYVRIGVPAGTTVDLVQTREGSIVETQRAETWQLLQFVIQPHYPNGEYALRAHDEIYPFIVTHSQAS